RHGLALTGPALAAAFTAGTAQAAVPGALTVTTLKAAAAGAAADAVARGLLSAQAAALTEGVMKAMLISKLKTLAAVLLGVGVFSRGAGLVTRTADEPGPGVQVAQAREGKKVIVEEEVGEGPDSGPKPAKKKPDLSDIEIELFKVGSGKLRISPKP